jgi:SAM-dependent methyltransferase
LAAERGAYAVGIDFSGASLRFAGQLRAALRINNSCAGAMELIQADATSLPFADGTFDRISMLDIIEHLTPSQLVMMMREVGRMLAPGGFAVVHTLPNRWVYDITFPLLNKFSSRFPSDPRGPIDRVVHINEQDLIGLSHTLKSCGLRHRLWLEQQMPAQARWNACNDQYGDNRDTVYPMLLGAAGSVLELLSLTPFKLLLCNDIYGLLWQEPTMPTGAKPRFAMTERFVAMFS